MRLTPCPRCLCRPSHMLTLAPPPLLRAVYDKDFSGALSAEEWEKVTLWHITRKKDEIITERSFHKCDTNNVRDQETASTFMHARRIP